MKVSLDSVFKVLMASAVIGAGVGYSKIYLFHVVFLVFCIFLGIGAVTGKAGAHTFPLVKTRYMYMFYIMIIWYALSLTWALSFYSAAKYLYYIIVGVLTVYMINSYATTRIKYSELFFIYKMAFLAAVAVGCLESIFDFRLPTSTFAHNYRPDAEQMSGLDDYSVEYILRSPTAFWGNPNNFAIGMLIIFPYFLLHPRNLVKLIGVLVLLGLIHMTGSRAALLGFLVCISCFCMSLLLRVNTIVLLISVAVLVPCMWFFSSAIIYFLNENFGYLLELIIGFQTGEARGDSVGVRIILILNGLRALWGSGGVGVGGGGSELIQLHSGLETLSMHNFWVEILVEAGVLFFVIFVVWYLAVVWRLYSIFRYHKLNFYRYHAGCLCLAMIAFIPGCVSASSVIYFFPMWIMFGMSVAIIHISESGT